MLKLCGALLIFFCGVSGACILNNRARAALDQTEGFIELVRRLRSDMDCFSKTIPAALMSCPDSVFEKCRIDLQTRRRRVEDLLLCCDIYSSELREIMEGFATRVGRGYKSEQIALCDMTLSRLDEHRIYLAGRLPAKQKINGTLCLCGALAVVILIV